MNSNERTILALRELADRLEATSLPIGETINHALSLSHVDGDDAARLLELLLRGAIGATLSQASQIGSDRQRA